MSSPFLSSAAAVAVLLIALSASAQQRELRVCADPDNMPFSKTELPRWSQRTSRHV